MGAGLAKKQVPVVGQFWKTQVLDSSWMSALVQAGRSGWCCSVFGSRGRSRPRCTGHGAHRMLFVGLLAYLIARSILESGLVDSTTAFMTFFLVSVLAGATPKPLLR